MADFWKRAMSRTKKVYIYTAGGGITALFAFLLVLSQYGITISTSGDIKCAGTVEEPCVSYINITTSDWALKFPRGVIYTEGDVTYQLYKADQRYSASNPARWKPFDINGKTMANESKWELKLVGYKKINETVKWGVQMGGTNVDPV